MTVTIIFLLLLLAVTVSADELTRDSVVLITGGAGFVGSELAMALHRTYQPKKIICVDNMDHLTVNQTAEESLALFDLKRQRAFHVMQVLGKEGHFYRADFRPSIPEYFDVGEVPILDYIWRDHPDISHVVHLADAYHRATKEVQAVPRMNQDIKSGMMEALLEQLRKVEAETGHQPSFVYASSYEVYNYFSPTDHNPSPFREERPITTPSSLRGTGKLLDELVARTYNEKYKIPSVGLRFFPIYGPWGLPGTPLYEMAERAVSDAKITVSTDDIRDYVYIDDAVDAIMSAMQVRTKQSIVINVGSGQGTTLHEIRQIMEKMVGTKVSSSGGAKFRTTAVASTERAREILGYEPQVSLEEGLMNVLSWHYDRAFPYGPENEGLKGISKCSAFDKECLRGAPVFPCAGECAHDTQCTTSYFDDVTAFTQYLTEACETVMYTVDLSNDLMEIPSAVGRLAKDKKSHLKDGHCNVAFVSEQSPLVRHLKQTLDYPFFSTVVEEFRRVEAATGKKVFLTHGFWTLAPLPIPSFRVGDEHILSLLPKLSPGAFFGEKTKRAIYCDPNVAFTNVNILLREAKMKPLAKGTEGGTALLVGHKHAQAEEAKPNIKESVQAAAYRMVRIGIIDQMISHPGLDSSWMVHSLQTEDARLFRCDVFQQVVQWDTTKDQSALEFVVGLHDMWTRVLLRGKEPWWIGESVVTVRESRRLTEVVAPDESSRRRLTEDLTTKMKKNMAAVKDETGPGKAFEIQLDVNDPPNDEAEDAVKAEEEGLEKVGELDLPKPAPDQDLEDDEQGTDEDAEARKQDAVPPADSGDDALQGDAPIDRDISAYDTWMGMLSSTNLQYFVRIVPSSEVGVVFLD